MSGQNSNSGRRLIPYRNGAILGLTALTTVSLLSLANIRWVRTADAESSGFLTASAPAQQFPFPSAFMADTCFSTRILVRSGDRVILGSLDTSAAPHEIGIGWDCSQISPCVEVEYVDGHLPVVHVTQERESASIPQRCELRRKLPLVQSESRPDTRNPAVSSSGCAAVKAKTRVFRIPQFAASPNQTDVGDQPKYCHLVCSSADLNIYAACQPDTQFERFGRAIIELYSSSVMPLVSSELGSIRDIDGDGRLSVVLCDLSDNAAGIPGHEPPVRGCVRAADFLDPSREFAADAVFLDDQLPSSQELAAVLAHECAHAAAFSLIREKQGGHDVPPWLHEAVAHTIETILEPDSVNLADRLDQYLATPHQYPLLTPAQPRALAGRGPERAAGMLFGVFVRSRGVPLRTLICSAAVDKNWLESGCLAEFSDVFRQWTLSLLDQKDKKLLPLHVQSLDSFRDRKLILCGTAACWIEAQRTGILEITARNSSRLQITVVHEDVPGSTHLAKSTWTGHAEGRKL